MSSRGAQGGYKIEKNAANKTLKDLYESINGPICFSNHHPDSLDFVWNELKDSINHHLSQTISQIIEKQNKAVLNYSI